MKHLPPFFRRRDSGSGTRGSSVRASESGTPKIESLEPRVLFSAAPVEPVPDAAAEPEPAADSQVVSEPVVSVEADAAAAAVAATAAAEESAVSLPANGSSEIDMEQNVNLVDIDGAAAELNAETLDALPVTDVSDASVQALWDEGIRRWEASGISPEQRDALQNATLEIRDLGGNVLGSTTGTSVVLDDDGAAQGWFVDATPGLDEEFSAGSAVADLGASDRVDLLTTILHEQGHVLGLFDLTSGSDDLMFHQLGEGERRLPTTLQADGADPGSITVESFLLLAPEETGVSISGGNLFITDILGANTDDDLTISATATTLTIVDNLGNGIDLGAVAGTGDGTSTVTIDFTEFGGGIIVNTLSGNDALTIDFGSGNFGREITFNGGAPSTGAGDQLFLTGGEAFDEAVFNQDTASNGTIDISGNSTITYTGLEPVISTITAADVTLNFNSIAGAETITVNDAGGGLTVVDSNFGESIAFTGPTDSLTINSGTGFDDIFVNGFGAGFDADLTIDGGTTVGPFAERDYIRFDANVALAAGNGATLIAEQVYFGIGSGITTSDGDISVTAGPGGLGSGIDLRDAALETGTGSITLVGEGSTSITRPDAANGIRGHDGIRIHNSTLETTDGDISLTGISGHVINLPGVSRGVSLFAESSVTAGGGGSLMILGTSASATLAHNDGVYFGTFTSASVVDGDLTIVGMAGGNAAFSRGVEMNPESSLSSTGDGDISVTGIGSIAVGVQTFNTGISVIGASILATGADAGDGDISLIGTGATGGISFNYGVELSGATVSSAEGAIDIDGQGGGRVSGNGIRNIGVYTTAETTLEAGTSRDLSIDGTGGAGRINTDGVQITGTDLSFRSGDVTITGTGMGIGAGLSNRGVLLSDSTITKPASGTGSVTVIGSTTGTGFGNTGVELSGVEIDTNSASPTGGSVTIAGTGSANGTLLNAGVKVSGSDINARDGIDIDGVGGGNGTGVQNDGVSIQTGSTLTDFEFGLITIDGTGGSGTSSNRGIYVGGGSLIVGSNVALEGTGNGTVGLNKGVEISGSRIETFDGDLTVRGTGSQTGSGVSNSGISVVNGGDLRSEERITLEGIGGTGSTLNEGIRIQSSSVDADGLAVTITGTANAATTGLLNSGVYIYLGSTVTEGGGGASTITGTGGGGAGAGLNHGVFMGVGIVSNVPLASITGTAGAGTLSEDLAGDFLV